VTGTTAGKKEPPVSEGRLNREEKRDGKRRATVKYHFNLYNATGLPPRPRAGDGLKLDQTVKYH
jgi:hypothetical protein